MALSADTAGSLADAYSASAVAWEAGPARVYDRLAVEVVARCPGGVDGRRVLDVGAGRGAAGRAARRAGAASVVPVDTARGMLRDGGGVVGDALALPFGDASFGAVVAAFSLNHVDVPAAGLAEAARVLAPGGGLVASAYAVDDSHPVKGAVEAACTAAGWAPAPWYEELRRSATPLLSTPGRALVAAAAAGLDDARAQLVAVTLPDLDAEAMVDWRLGMAQVGPFLSSLSPAARQGVRADALDRLGPRPPVLVRRMVVLTWSRPHTA